jgi:ubiquinone/menaquinone biosynthesis C-methylase UbiE
LAGLDYLQPGPILEVGFGTGELLMTMAARGFDVTGLELSPQMHHVTGRKLRRKGAKIKRIRGRTEAIPLASDVFSNVILTFPSNYIMLEATLNEIHRILDKRGRLVIVGLSVRFKLRWLQWFAGWILSEPSDKSIHHLIQKLDTVGFMARVIEHSTEAYSLPVLVLERKDDD